MSAPTITYEHPLAERIRTLLRLEALFTRADFFIRSGEPHNHHVAVLTLFEILEIVTRSELKSELLQEFERQRQVMSGFRSNPEANQHILDRVLQELDRAGGAIHAMTGKVGQHLRDNEWLMSIKQRTGIPGGVCEFDLPTYHHWLHRDGAVRTQALLRWISPLYPVRDGASLVLNILRESGKPSHVVATQGTYQQMLGGRTAQMIRIRLPLDAPCVPEISANRYALNVRFLTIAEEARSKPIELDVPFDLTFCSL